MSWFDVTCLATRAEQYARLGVPCPAKYELEDPESGYILFDCQLGEGHDGPHMHIYRDRQAVVSIVWTEGPQQGNADDSDDIP